MKKKALIIISLVVAQLFAFHLISHAQVRDKCPSVINSSELIADETTLKQTKTEAKIVCCNDSIFNAIFKSHQQLFKKFTCTWKHDRYGSYKEYIIYLQKDDAAIIVNWAKNNYDSKNQKR